mgnify:CR=1 FL=1
MVVVVVVVLSAVFVVAFSSFSVFHIFVPDSCDVAVAPSGTQREKLMTRLT